MFRSLQMPRTKGPAKQVHPTGELITVGPEERERLKKQRLKRDLLGRDLAARVGVTAATISNLETGRSKQVKKTVYAKIYRVLFGSPETAAAVAQDKDASYRKIVEGALELDEHQQKAVADLIDSLKKPR